ncbi:MAG: Rpn family recombination-promoting nuclease/putative transposase [Chitinispirillales bacterium]|jgi:predicted transposase/invertase (TIGR01784 family)|nr:Rpn family recombination-promoting nuclease/putative transposase [Chitinispirillales bacterium]
MEQINDISFVIDGKIVVLIEHQSTINENMPLRMLLYIARVYEKICQNDNLYRVQRVTIPRPEFIVLYNGKEKMQDEQTLRLSDMFAKYGEKNPIELELTVKIYNINKGHNVQIAQRSTTLDGYESFVHMVREYEKETKNLENAISRAITYCINRNILKEFLETNGSEVMNMLLKEWKLEEALKVREQESLEKGIKIGKEEAKEEAKKETLKELEELIKQGVTEASELLKKLSEK